MNGNNYYICPICDKRDLIESAKVIKYIISTRDLGYDSEGKHITVERYCHMRICSSCAKKRIISFIFAGLITAIMIGFYIFLLKLDAVHPIVYIILAILLYFLWSVTIFDLITKYISIDLEKAKKYNALLPILKSHRDN